MSWLNESLYYREKRITSEDIKDLAYLLSPRPFKNGQGYLVHCPAHDDKTASLALASGSSRAIIFKCHAGCNYYAIRDALLLIPGLPERIRSFYEGGTSSTVPTTPTIQHRKKKKIIRMPRPIVSGHVIYSLFEPLENQPAIKCIKPMAKQDTVSRFGDLIGSFQCIESKAKENLNRISGVLYKPGATRGYQGIDYVTMLVLDFDGVRAELASVFAKTHILDTPISQHLSFGHTTASHSEEAGYYRIFMPLKNAIPIELWPQVEGALSKDLETVQGLDQPAWRDPSKMYVVPCYQKEHQSLASHTTFQGVQPLDVTRYWLKEKKL